MDKKDKKEDIETVDLVLLSDISKKLHMLQSHIIDSKSAASNLINQLNSKFTSYEIRSDELESVLTEVLAFVSDFEEQFDTIESQMQPLLSMLKRLDDDSGGIRERKAKNPPFIDFYRFDSTGSCTRNFQPVGGAVMMWKCFYNKLGGFKVGIIEDTKKFIPLCMKLGIKPSPRYFMNAIDLDDGNRLKVVELPRTAYLQLMSACTTNTALLGDMTDGLACTVVRKGKNLNTVYTVTGKKRKLTPKEQANIQKYGLYDIKKSYPPAKNEQELKDQLEI